MRANYTQPSNGFFANLYAGLGGTTDLLDENKFEITHIELNPKI